MTQPRHQIPDEQLWARVDPTLRAAAVRILRTELHPQSKSEIRKLIEEHGPDDWMPPTFHFQGGMAIRNLLREHGLKDAMLPPYDEWYGEGTDVRNWDDYYNQALVEAVME